MATYFRRVGFRFAAVGVGVGMFALFAPGVVLSPVLYPLFGFWVVDMMVWGGELIERLDRKARHL